MPDEGFEPPKRNAADLQSAPFGHSGNPAGAPLIGMYLGRLHVPPAINGAERTLPNFLKREKPARAKLPATAGEPAHIAGGAAPQNAIE